MALELFISPVSDPLLPNSCQPSTTNLRAHWLCLLLRFPATFLYEIPVKGPKILANSSCKVVMFLMFSFLLTYSWKLHSFLGWNKETKDTVALVKKKKKGNILGKKRAAGFGRGAYILADQVFAAIVFLFSFSKSLPKSDQSLSSQRKKTSIFALQKLLLCKKLPSWKSLSLLCLLKRFIFFPCAQTIYSHESVVLTWLQRHRIHQTSMTAPVEDSRDKHWLSQWRRAMAGAGTEGWDLVSALLWVTQTPRSTKKEAF